MYKRLCCFSILLMTVCFSTFSSGASYANKCLPCPKLSVVCNPPMPYAEGKPHKFLQESHPVSSSNATTGFDCACKPKVSGGSLCALCHKKFSDFNRKEGVVNYDSGAVAGFNEAYSMDPSFQLCGFNLS